MKYLIGVGLGLLTMFYFFHTNEQTVRSADTAKSSAAVQGNHQLNDGVFLKLKAASKTRIATDENLMDFQKDSKELSTQVGINGEEEKSKSYNENTPMGRDAKALKASLNDFDLEEYRSEVKKNPHGSTAFVGRFATNITPHIEQAKRDKNYAETVTGGILGACAVDAGNASLPYSVRAFCLSQLYKLSNIHQGSKILQRELSNGLDKVPARVKTLARLK